MSGIQWGVILPDGSFTQQGMRQRPHEPEDAGYTDCLVCVCGTDLRACQECCELFHGDEAVTNRFGDPICQPCATRNGPGGSR